ncbi:hypothetical protein DFH06DRAFT_973948 [Mycena polygramma]|nr:hypothetical protein DFH06DRAFT_973948 [Mycena polygramma]
MVQKEIAEIKRTGEDPMDRIMREKSEWAQADAKSAELKIEGNNAFRTGDYKTAYVIYTTCSIQSPLEPLYPLNRAAVALKLKLYEAAVEDASHALDQVYCNRAKAHFRRGQAQYFLGKWDEAGADYAEALTLQPGDPSVIHGVAELNRLRNLPAEEQTTWILAQAPVDLRDVFEPEELERRVEELLGHPMVTEDDKDLARAFVMAKAQSM